MKLATEKALSWPLSWDAAPGQLQPDQARRLLKAVGQRDRVMLAAIKNVRTTMGLRAAHRLQRRYLLSASTKLAAISGSWQAKYGSINDSSDQEVVDLVRIAADLYAWKAAPGQALAWPMTCSPEIMPLVS